MHELPALAPRDRATSRGCLDGIKMKLAAIMRTVTGQDDDIDLEIGGPSDSRPGKRRELEDADRLTRDFLRNPGAVLGAGNYAMTTSADFEQDALTQAAQLVAGPGAPDIYLVTQKSNATVRFFAEHSRYPAARELQVGAAEEEDGPVVLYLPWQDSKLTYRELDDDAHLVLTGPLNGCSVFVVEVTGGESGKGTYLFHVNTNTSGLRGSEAAEAQRRKFDSALDRLWPDASKRRVTHRLDFSDYGPRSDDVSAEAIAYGVRSGSGEWEFAYYVIDVDERGDCERRSGTPDPLPREATT
jgi:hypothetical protein